MKTRTVKDSMGELQVPADALYGAQTQRAIDNFPISGIRMPRRFIQAMCLIKAGNAVANKSLQLVDGAICDAIETSALSVAKGEHDTHFPIDIFQTGSGTSTNMNANEVISMLASTDTLKVHPNDHVNYGQSSNDVVPSSVHVGAAIALHETLLPALTHLHSVLSSREKELAHVTKTGRTHLMDAMPVTLGQEIGAWRMQIENGIERVTDASKRLQRICIGGTAVGTGINAHPEAAGMVAAYLSKKLGIAITQNPNLFEGLSTMDAAVEMSGQLKVLACSLIKISNDLRWMNSGPLAGLTEIALPDLQPGSSIMPGKVNPVIPEAMCMVCAQVIGNDMAITMGGQSGNFELNVMLPMIAHNLIQSIEILGNAARLLADKAIAGFTVNTASINERLFKNPILVTALNSVIGYETGAKIAKKAYAEGISVVEATKALTTLSEAEILRLLDPKQLTHGGIRS